MFGLRQKLSLGFGGLFMIILIIGIQSIVQFKDLGQSIDVILRENYKSVIACQEMKEALERMDSGILFTFVGYRERGNELIRINERKFTQAMEIELHNITVPGEAGRAATLKALFLQYQASLHELQRQNLPISVRQDRYFKDLLPLFSGIKGAADDILKMNHDNMNVANDRARKQAAAARERMYLFLVAGAVIALCFMMLIGRWILLPIKRLIRSTETISEGNLNLVVQVDSHDEIGRLSQSFDDMAANLREFHRSDQAKLTRTQQATKEAFNNLSDAIAIVDMEGIVEVSTRSAIDIFGFKTGVHLRDIPVGGLYDRYQGIVRGSAANQQGKTGHVFQQFVHGEERFFLPDATPINDHAGRLTGVLVILKDATEERRTEEMKSGIISTVSHQLKTPLTSIRMAVHLLLEEKVGGLTEKQTELLMAAREDSDRLHRILANLLDISRIESGRLQMTCQDVFCRALVLEATEPFLHVAQEKGVELKTTITEDLPKVCVDMNQISHVFSNLLSNALRYTEPGGRITVAAEPAGPMVRFSVADTGSGIPLQFRERIFEQFFRVPDQRNETGSGLGLSIAKEIVEAHGGHINVESREGKGTTFTFTLRRANAEKENG